MPPRSSCPMQLQRIQTLYLKDDVIIGEIQPRERCGRGKFEIDTPADGDKSTKDLVRAAAASHARHQPPPLLRVCPLLATRCANSCRRCCCSPPGPATLSRCTLVSFSS
jgi:hypothetical protein